MLVTTVACIAWAGAGMAQQPDPRGRVAGWIEHEGGGRVRSATVTLLSRPLPGRADLGTADEILVRTGEDGMFRAALLHGRAYSAWATFRDADGVEQRTAVLEDLVPGPPRAMRAAGTQVLRRVQLEGLANWQGHGPFALTAHTNTDNVAVYPLQLDEQRSAAVPTMPGPTCDFELRSNSGQLLAVWRSQPLAADQRELRLEVAAGRSLRIRVLDKAGAPIRDAKVRHWFGYHVRDLSTVLGTTDETGSLQVVVPSKNGLYVFDDRNVCNFEITARGRQRVVKMAYLNKVEDTLEIRLDDGVDVVGRVLTADGERPRGLTLLPDCYARGADSPSGIGTPPRPVAMDDEGRFHFTGLHPRYDFRLLALLDPQLAREQGLALRPGIASAPIAWLAVARRAEGAPLRLPDLRLDRIPVANIRVTTADGLPVPGARLLVSSESLHHSPMTYVCDRVGRLQFPLPDGQIRIGAYVSSGRVAGGASGGVATVLVRPPRNAGDPGIDPLVLRLSPTFEVRGRIVDADGEPVSAAEVYVRRITLEDRALRSVALKSRVRSVSDADGGYSLTVPALPGAEFTVHAYAKIAGAWQRSADLVVTADGDGNEALRIELKKDKTPR